MRSTSLLGALERLGSLVMHNDVRYYYAAFVNREIARRQFDPTAILAMWRTCYYDSCRWMHCGRMAKHFDDTRRNMRNHCIVMKT